LMHISLSFSDSGHNIMTRETLFSSIIYQNDSTVWEEGAIAAMSAFLPFSLFIDD
jgi:hypothetical protein